MPKTRRSVKKNKKNYKAYMASPEWRAKRKEYSDSGRLICCWKCNTFKQVHLHHRTYVRFGDEAITDLVPLCEEHHVELHKLQRDEKLTVEAATSRYLGKKPRGKMRKKPRSPRPKPTAQQCHIQAIVEASKERQAEREATYKRLGMSVAEPYHAQPRTDPETGLIRSKGRKPRRNPRRTLDSPVSPARGSEPTHQPARRPS